MTTCVKIWPCRIASSRWSPPGIAAVRAGDRGRGLRARPAGARRAVVVRADRLRRASGAAAGDRGGFGFVVEHGLEALAEADTVSCPAGTASRRPRRRRRPRGARARRADRLDLQRGLPARRRGPARRRARRRRTGATPSRLARRHPARRASTPDVLYVDDGERADVGGQRGGDRPLPAHRAPRPWQRGRQRGRAPAGDPAASRRRPGAADRAADARAPRRRPDRAA